MAPERVGPVAVRVAEVEVVDAQRLLEHRRVRASSRTRSATSCCAASGCRPDDAGAVAEAVGVPVVRGAQQQRGGVDRAAGDDHDVGASSSSTAPSRSTTTPITERPDGVRLEPGHQRAGEQSDVRVAQRRLDADDLRVGLAVDQAGEAVAGRAPDAGRAFRRAPRRSGCRWAAGTGAGPAAAQVAAQLRDARLVADRRVRVGRGGRRLGRVDAPLAVHLVELLGPGVPGLEVGVADRPRGRDAVDVLDRARSPARGTGTGSPRRPWCCRRRSSAAWG